MQATYVCSECTTTVRLPSSSKIKTVTCSRCGDVSFVTDGNVRRVYPALHMEPMTSLRVQELSGVLSKWMPTNTRPVMPGPYQCRFRATEPTVLQLYWTGQCFRDAPGGKRVAMDTFLTWRGVLA